MMPKPLKRVVVIGGGTGTFPVISALKELDVELTSCIAVSDSGGSTGRIRDEFGFQPVGDLRQALAALAHTDGQEWIRNILLYRFKKGEGLKGHNLGNLILTALQDMTGDTTEALEIAEKVFRLRGEVVPVTRDNVHLEITFEDGEVVVGEHFLDEDVTTPHKIRSVRLVPEARINPKAEQAIIHADLIVIGPGDYYASLMAALSPQGMQHAFAVTNANIVYLVNLMTRITQTHEMSAHDHVRGIEAAIGRPIDTIIIHRGEIPTDTLTAYANHHEYPVIDDLDQTTHGAQILRDDLINMEVFEQSEVDTAHRSLLRHDPEKIKNLLKKLLEPSA